MHTLDPLVYWKFKSQLLEISVEEVQLQARFAVLQQRRHALLSEQGIPIGNYTFDDTAHAVIPVPGQAPAPAPADAQV